MKRRLTKREYVIAGFFALAAMLPLATSMDGGSIEVLPPLASVSLPAPESIQNGQVMQPIVTLPTIQNPS